MTSIWDYINCFNKLFVFNEQNFLIKIDKYFNVILILLISLFIK